MMNLLKHDSKDGMASAACVIHLSACSCTTGVTHLHMAHNLRDIFDRCICEVLNIRPLRWRFTDLKIVWGLVWMDGNKEIANVLVIDFEVRDPYVVRDV